MAKKSIKKPDLKEAKQSARVSLVPDFSTPDPEMQEPVPSLDDIISDVEDRNALETLISKHAAISAIVKQGEKEKEGYSNRIKGLLDSHGVLGTLKCNDYTLSYAMTSRSSINAGRLLAAGVALSIIKGCTDVTESKRLSITPARA